MLQSEMLLLCVGQKLLGAKTEHADLSVQFRSTSFQSSEQRFTASEHLLHLGQLGGQVQPHLEDVHRRVPHVLLERRGVCRRRAEVLRQHHHELVNIHWGGMELRGRQRPGLGRHIQRRKELAVAASLVRRARHRHVRVVQAHEPQGEQVQQTQVRPLSCLLAVLAEAAEAAVRRGHLLVEEAEVDALSVRAADQEGGEHVADEVAAHPYIDEIGEGSSPHQRITACTKGVEPLSDGQGGGRLALGQDGVQEEEAEALLPVRCRGRPPVEHQKRDVVPAGLERDDDGLVPELRLHHH